MPKVSLSAKILIRFPQLGEAPALAREKVDAMDCARRAVSKLASGKALAPADYLAGGAGIGGALLAAMAMAPDWASAIAPVDEFCAYACGGLNDDHFSSFSALLRAGVRRAASVHGVEPVQGLKEAAETVGASKWMGSGARAVVIDAICDGPSWKPVASRPATSMDDWSAEQADDFCQGVASLVVASQVAAAAGPATAKAKGALSL